MGPSGVHTLSPRLGNHTLRRTNDQSVFKRIEGSKVALYMHSPKRQQMIMKAQQPGYSVGVKCWNEAQYMRRADVAQVVVRDSAASSLENSGKALSTISSEHRKCSLSPVYSEALIVSNPIIRVQIFIRGTQSVNIFLRSQQSVFQQPNGSHCTDDEGGTARIPGLYLRSNLSERSLTGL